MASFAPATDLTLSTSDLPASTELLSYYRTRIGEFERDLEDAAARTNAIEVSHEELHRTQWELKVRHEEVAELQRALSDANVYLFDEREQVLKLQAENDQVSVRSIYFVIVLGRGRVCGRGGARGSTVARDPNGVSRISLKIRSISIVLSRRHVAHERGHVLVLFTDLLQPSCQMLEVRAVGARWTVRSGDGGGGGRDVADGLGREVGILTVACVEQRAHAR